MPATYIRYDIMRLGVQKKFLGYVFVERQYFPHLTLEIPILEFIQDKQDTTPKMVVRPTLLVPSNR